MTYSIGDIIGRLTAWLTGEQKSNLEEAGRKAAQAAEQSWQLDVFDPPIGSKHPRAAFCLQVINSLIHEAGWTWITYKGDGPPQWCGLASAAWWRAAGLDPKLLAMCWASTVRLDHWARGEAWEGKPVGSPRPFIALGRNSKPSDCVFPDGSLPRAGDICVVGDGDPAVGDHICVTLSYDPETGTFTTISGNGGGVGPHGDRRQGISKADYRVGTAGYHVLRVYRPLVSDLLRR